MQYRIILVEVCDIVKVLDDGIGIIRRLTRPRLVEGLWPGFRVQIIVGADAVNHLGTYDAEDEVALKGGLVCLHHCGACLLLELMLHFCWMILIEAMKIYCFFVMLGSALVG